MLLHEYAVIGHSRAAWGRHLGTAAAIIASVCAAIAVAGFELAQKLGLSNTGQVILWPLSAAIIFPFAHWLFDKWIWKWGIMSPLLNIPDLNGEWECQGLTTSSDPQREWEGTVIISQTWEKIKLHLRTSQSTSSSISAALLHEPGLGYRLMYSYRNSPRLGEPELAAHVGFCEFIFAEALTSADGEYFNNHGRTTSGRMRLTRKAANGN